MIFFLLLILFYLFRNLSEAVRIGGVIFGLILFYSIDHFFDIKFKTHHYIYVLAILFFGILLSPLYFISSSYDKILHFFLIVFSEQEIPWPTNRLFITIPKHHLRTFIPCEDSSI